MPKLGPVSYRQLARVFEADGFRCVREEGYHMVFTKPGVIRPVVIPKATFARPACLGSRTSSCSRIESDAAAACVTGVLVIRAGRRRAPLLTSALAFARFSASSAPSGFDFILPFFLSAFFSASPRLRVEVECAWAKDQPRTYPCRATYSSSPKMTTGIIASPR